MASANIIPATWKLPSEIASRLSPTTYGRQRAIIESGQIVLVLHRPPKPDVDEREGVLFWRDARGDWQASRKAAGGIRQHIRDYSDRETELSNQFDKATSLKDLFEILEALTPLTRAARNMHSALQSARDGIPDDPFLIEMRDFAYEVERNFELLTEDVRNSIHYRMVRDNEEQAKFSREAATASHRLTILAALFFPLTGLGSLFGMNVPSGLEGSGFGGFVFLAFLGIGLGVGTVVWVLAPVKGSRPSPPTLSAPKKPSKLR